ncbi:MAG: ATP-dependent DNA helicase RecG, partial [bacterium]|nr:ATP-dependent DNA helicase RecG [bacterium]
TLAKTRLAFDELLLLQIKATARRKDWEKIVSGHAFAVDRFEKQIADFWERLPFSLTDSQKQAIHAIFQDLEKSRPMNRLLQGDVGSGKTVVATVAMYLSFLNGFQSVLMAPTEILAQQHFKTISDLLSPLGVNVDLVTGSTKAGSKKLEMRSKKLKTKPEAEKSSQFPSARAQGEGALRNSHFDVLVGTHAVLYEKAKFNRLGLIVIDEQQRFGVAQRSLIRQKGDNPHVLTMTATPIPRTVALTMYGDLDLSYLDDMPKGRRIIKTWLVPKQKRDGAYHWIRKQINETDSQAFIICPFIEQSETMQTVKAASVEYDRLKKEVFPDLRLGLLHGKMKTKEKDDVLLKFREKKFDILVATPVVEVGIDIPNATVMLIEASERFGLAQLHQLRGRVGRGEKQSFCLLFTETTSPQTLQKLKSLESTHVGAQLAELDLRLRGAGELYGTLQSGIPELKIASFSDVALIQKAKRTADILYTKLSTDPDLQKRFSASIDASISPD